MFFQELEGTEAKIELDLMNSSETLTNSDQEESPTPSSEQE